MAHRDSLLGLFKPVLWLVAASFLVGFAGVLAVAGPSSWSSSAGQAELASAMAVIEQAPQDS
jgi:hypothetical protein